MQHSRGLTADPKKTTAGAKKKAPAEDVMPETGLLAANKAVVTDGQQTDLLEGSEATGLLVDEDATAPLHDEPKPIIKRTGGKKLKMLDEVMLIHTDEVIS